MLTVKADGGLGAPWGTYRGVPPNIKVDEGVNARRTLAASQPDSVPWCLREETAVVGQNGMKEQPASRGRAHVGKGGQHMSKTNQGRGSSGRGEGSGVASKPELDRQRTLKRILYSLYRGASRKSQQRVVSLRAQILSRIPCVFHGKRPIHIFVTGLGKP